MAGESKVQRLKVLVRPDRMEARIRFVDRVGEPPTADEVRDALEREDIAITDEVSANIAAYCLTLADDVERFKPAVIAKGRRAEAGCDAKFTWHKALAPKKRAGRRGEDADHYTFRSLVAVEAETLLGELTFAVPACEGVDVSGKTISGGPRPKDIELNRSVRVEGEAPAHLYASVAGVVRFEKQRLWIDEVVQIDGDVDFSTGSVICAVDVQVAGAVLDNFMVKSGGAITVTGPIQGAIVSARKDIEANGGILAGGRGLVEAERKLVTKFAEEANLRVGGDLVVATALINCDVEVTGKLAAPQAALRGGRIFAHHGAEISELGSGSATPTRLAIGIHPSIAAEALEKDDEISSILHYMEPFRLEHQKWMALAKTNEGLTPQQDIRRRQVSSEIEFLQGLIDEITQARDQLLINARPDRKATLQIGRIIQPGAQIQFGTLLALLRRPVRGPVRLESRMVDGKRVIVAVTPAGGATVLPAVRSTHRSRRALTHSPVHRKTTRPSRRSTRPSPRSSRAAPSSSRPAAPSTRPVARSTRPVARSTRPPRERAPTPRERPSIPGAPDSSPGSGPPDSTPRPSSPGGDGPGSLDF